MVSFYVGESALRGMCPVSVRTSLLGVFDRRYFRDQSLMSAVRWLVALVSATAIMACGATEPVPVANEGSPNSMAAKGKGGAVTPQDFPGAPQSLVFEGTVSAEVSYGHPSSCGAGSGPTGPVIFGYGAYFQVEDHWFLLNTTTDGSAKAYTGPGSYPARGWLFAVGLDGSTNLRYQGTVTLQVTQDAMPATGTVNGSLSDDRGNLERVSGGWTCNRGPLLGPG